MRDRVAAIGFIILMLSVSPVYHAGADMTLDENIHSGPYLEEILFKFISQDDQLFLALQDGEIDIMGGFLDPSFLDTLLIDYGVRLKNTPRNGYGYMSFNCEKYPFNISAFRRAVAFAVDKYEICDDIWDGLAQPQDSIVPSSNPLSIEGKRNISYYNANLTVAESLLDAQGFLDLNEDGYRELPNGTEFSVRVDYATSSNIAQEIANHIVDALVDIGVNATSYAYDFYIYPYDPYTGDYENYDITFGGKGFGDTFDLEWLAYPFSQGFAYNLPKWSNASYESWSEQLLLGTTYEEISEAAEMMQEIWLEECPLVICYQNLLLSGYRDDTFTGFVEDAIVGVPNFWTNFKVRLNSEPIGQVGGTLRWGLPLEPDTFNLMASSNAYSEYIFDLLYDSLLKRGPDGNSVPWLASDYSIQTTNENNTIPEGHSRITFDILENGTWSDGMPITSLDVAYCMEYYRDAVDNPIGRDLQGLVLSYTPTNYQVVFEFNTTSFWNINKIGYTPILPKHLLENLGLDGWSSWDPDPQVEDMITSGPFEIGNYTTGHSIELIRNPSYFYQPKPVDTTPTNATDTDFTLPLENVALVGVGISAIVVIMVIVVVKKRGI